MMIDDESRGILCAGCEHPKYDHHELRTTGYPFPYACDSPFCPCPGFFGSIEEVLARLIQGQVQLAQLCQRTRLVLTANAIYGKFGSHSAWQRPEIMQLRLEDKVKRAAEKWWKVEDFAKGIDVQPKWVEDYMMKNRDSPGIPSKALLDFIVKLMKEE